MRTATLCTLIGGASVLLRASTLGNAKPGRFLHMHESFYSAMAQESGFIPTYHGHVNANTGPLWVWLVQLSGHLTGDWFFGPRIVSLLSFAVGGVAVYHLAREYGQTATVGAVSAWFTFPLSVFLAGRNQPDMLLATLVAFALLALRNENVPLWLGLTLGGLMLKQTFLLVAVIAGLRHDKDYIRYGTALVIVGSVVVALLLFLTTGVLMLLEHFLIRIPGFGSADYVLQEGAILGLGPLAVYLGAFGMREPAIRWYGFLCGVFLLFTMWAATPGAWYYLLPISGPLAVLMGVGIGRTNRKWYVPMFMIQAGCTVLALYRYGEL